MTSLLLIHGALGAAPQVAPLADALRDTYDVHCVELRGHGDSPVAAGEFRIEYFAQDVRELMAARSIEHAAIFGYSMGGYVALYLAARWPKLVTSVATLATKLAWTPDVAARETGRLDAATIRAKVPKFAELLERRHAGAGGWESVLANTSTLMRSLGDSPVVNSALLASVRQRTRLMVGDRDNVVSVDETLSVARSLAAGDAAVLPNTPHPFEQVRVGLLAAMLRDFVGSDRN